MAAGTDSTTSSLTSTSHTLTQAPGMASLLSGNDVPSILAFLDSCKPANRHAFLQPPSSIPTASLHFAKNTLDAFAGQVGDEQQRALAGAGKKRKRGLENGVARREVLRIRKLHVDGFETDQVWQQAKRIISSALSQSREALKELRESEIAQTAASALHVRENGVEAGSDVEDLEDSSDGSSLLGDEDVGDDHLAAEGLGEDEDEDENENDVDGGDSEALGDEEKEIEEDDDDDEDDLAQPDAFYAEDPNGLNDGFFSIDDFNKQTQWLEDQDARADPNTDLVSDEEGLDWHTDPMSPQMPNGKPKKRRKNADADSELGLDEEEDEDMGEEDDDGEEEDGPTFGNMDLFAPEGASEDEAGNGPDDETGLDLTANDIFYKDFFAPPAKKAKKGARRPRTANPKASRPDDTEVERAMADVRRDLFDDISERSGSEDALSEVSAGDPRSRRSAHERRQAKILEEIRRLEAEAVKAKRWTMSGEASASARPLDSLLEEELEFEHAGKPVPVITQEVSESIEDMVKRRIVEQKFDEVLRRRPGALGDGLSGARRGLVEIDDAKGQQSLAEIYEEEHVKKNNPDTYVSQSDEKLQKEEKEIERMWKELSGKLDALSSWHYKPKPAAPSLTVVADVATIAMEDAQPTTARGVGGGESMMAPQEVYKAGTDTAEKGDVVVAKSGLPVARQEMTREDKLRRRRRQKERIRKSDDAANGKPTSKKAQEKRDTVAELKRGGVKVINRQGEVLGIDGKKAKAARPVTSGSYKL